MDSVLHCPAGQAYNVIENSVLFIYGVQFGCKFHWPPRLYALGGPSSACHTSLARLLTTLVKSIVNTNTNTLAKSIANTNTNTFLTEVGKSIQPLGAPPDFTTNSDLEARYAVVSQA